MDNDTIEIQEILSALRRRYLWVVGGVLLGLGLAVAALRFLEPEYEAAAAVLLRSGSAASPMAALGGELGGLASVLGAGGSSGVTTELRILTSRSVIGEVVDSLGLQARVLEPSGLGARDLFQRAEIPPVLRSAVYEFERSGEGYAVRGPGAQGRAVPGQPYALGDAVVVLRAGELPEEFRVQVVDREGAIGMVREELESETTGDVAELVYRSGDAETAAAVPNALISHYLTRRRTTDRGTNQHRFEFLSAKTDSIALELAEAESQLRSHQEESGILDPQLVGQAGVERVMALRASLEEVEVERRALTQMMGQIASGGAQAHDLAAYPTFLKNGAISSLLASMLELETERATLLQRRTERDEEVVALSRSIDHLATRLGELSRTYLNGLERQRAEYSAELARYDRELGGLPAEAEESFRREREVERLSETLLALQTQLVQARVAAITEGGDVRQLDVAVAPSGPAFPRAPIVLTIGLFGGLLLGVVGGLGSAYLSPRVRDARQAELLAGAPAVAFRPGMPLFLGGGEETRSLLVLPIGAGAQPGLVARSIAATAHVQGRDAVVADLTGGPVPAIAGASTSAAVVRSGDVGAGEALVHAGEREGYAVYRGAPGTGLRPAFEALESRFELVVAALPGIWEPAGAALLHASRPAVLVAHQDRLSRAELQQAATALRRLGVPLVGVVLHNGHGSEHPDP